MKKTKKSQSNLYELVNNYGHVMVCASQKTCIKIANNAKCETTVRPVGQE